MTETAAPEPPRWHPAVRSLLYLIAFFGIQVAASVAVLLPLRALGRDPGQRGLSVLLIFAVMAFLRLLDRRSLASLGVRSPAGGEP